MSVRTPLSHEKSRGASREGVGHWKLQRLTAISNVFLVVWFVISVISLSDANYRDTALWLAHPFNTTLMALLVISTFIHAPVGLQVVIEDYVHHEGVKMASLIAIRLMAVALAVSCLIAIIKVSLGS